MRQLPLLHSGVLDFQNSDFLPAYGTFNLQHTHTHAGQSSYLGEIGVYEYNILEYDNIIFILFSVVLCVDNSA